MLLHFGLQGFIGLFRQAQLNPEGLDLPGALCEPVLELLVSEFPFGPATVQLRATILELDDRFAELTLLIFCTVNESVLFLEGLLHSRQRVAVVVEVGA